MVMPGWLIDSRSASSEIRAGPSARSVSSVVIVLELAWVVAKRRIHIDNRSRPSAISSRSACSPIASLYKSLMQPQWDEAVTTLVTQRGMIGA